MQLWHYCPVLNVLIHPPSYLLCISGDYEAAIREHQQELSFSEVLNDVIGRAVANRKIGECYAEMGNIEAALKVSRLVCFIQKGFLWPFKVIISACNVSAIVMQR